MTASVGANAIALSNSRAGRAKSLNFDHLPMRDEASAVGRLLDRAIEPGLVDLFAATALLAKEQNALVGMAEVGAGRVGVAAFDLVNEAVLQKELEGAIDGGRRDRLALEAAHLVDDRIGPERRVARRRIVITRRRNVVSCSPLLAQALST